MSLPQLIGQQCVTCTKQIASIIDGTFCDACGNPIHLRCADTAPPVQKDMCPQCGGDPASNIAKEVSRERGTQTQKKQMEAATETTAEPVAFPISKVCPKCGHDKFTRQRPQGWVAFAWDRKCNECGTIYSPPTPVWAAIVFILAGLLLSSFGGFGVVVAINSGNPLSLPAFACQGFLGVIGLLALIHGLRTLAAPPKT